MATRRPRKFQHRSRFSPSNLLDVLTSRDDEKSHVLLRDLLGFPDDLPDLARRRPPNGNTRPDGAMRCYYTLRKQGLLSAVY
jgi:hypothetical protein